MKLRIPLPRLPAVLLTLLISSLVVAQTPPLPPVQRQVQNQTIHSQQNPAADLTFAKEFHSVGAQVVSALVSGTMRLRHASAGRIRHGNGRGPSFRNPRPVAAGHVPNRVDSNDPAVVIRQVVDVVARLRKHDPSSR